jgi:uncharacterized membrane protein YesL
MSGILDPNSGVMGFMGKIFDVIFLSLIWLVLSLPIVTMGASTTALYYTTVKTIRRERGYTFKEFFNSFKMNFVISTIIWIILLLLGFMLYFNIRFAYATGGNLGFALLVAYSMMVLFIVGTAAYIFPVLSRFKMKFKDVIKTSAFMGMKHLPSTILFIIIIGLSVFALWYQPILSILLPTLSTLLYSLLMERILKKYTPKTGEEGEKDLWYLE